MNLPGSRTLEQDGWSRAEQESIDYHGRWRAYRLRWWLELLLALGWPPLVVGLFYGSRHYWHTPFLSLTGMSVWLVTAIAAVWWQGEFRCPRCRRRYGALGNRKGDSNYTRGFFDKICANCKLRKFETG